MDDFVEVARALVPDELEMLRARLEGERIPTLVTDANTNRMNALWSIALGGSRLMVPANRADSAREIIALLRSGAFSIDENQDVGPLPKPEDR
jgi:hypothetical protein